MKNSEFQKAYLNIISEENKRNFKYFIFEDDNKAKKPVDPKVAAGLANKAGQVAADSKPPKEKGWWSKAWDACVSVVQKTPVLGDIVAVCSGAPEKGPLVKAGIEMYDAGKDAFTPQEVKDFKEAIKKDPHLQQVVKQSGIDINDDDQVKKMAGYLRQQAAIAKKAADDADFKKKLQKEIKAKFEGDKKARTAGKEIRKYCPGIFKHAGKDLKDGEYIIHLED